MPYRNKVLIILGENKKIRKSLRNFLLSLGLQAVEWSEALLMSEKPDPDYGEVIKSIFKHCQTVVVLLTNDQQDENLSVEVTGLRLLPQAELNALFIAGVAASIDRHRTVVAGLGNPEPFRNIPGLNVTGLDNTLKKRKSFIELLRAAGCEIKTKGEAWQISGDFDIELKLVLPEKQQTSKPADLEPIKETQSPPAQPPGSEDTSPKKTAAGGPSKIEPPAPQQPARGRSLIDSFPLINILRPVKEPAPKKQSGDHISEEGEFIKRIKELEAQLETLKNRGGRSSQRAAKNLEKQIQAEKYRLRTIRQLANIENIRKSYEGHNNKGKKEDA